MTTRFLFAIGLTLTLNSCAVLNVDVDVYKGPLANHEEVQLEQMAAMAIGAKPLLEKLCQSLEIEHLEDEHKKSESLENKYRPDCSLPGIKLDDQRAKSVQTVLSLYRDLYPPEIATLVNDVVSNSAIYESVYTDLRPGEKAPLEEDRQLWSDSYPAMWDLKSAEHPAIKDATSGKKEEGVMIDCCVWRERGNRRILMVAHDHQSCGTDCKETLWERRRSASL